MKKCLCIVGCMLFTVYGRADLMLSNLSSIPTTNIAESYTPNMDGVYQTRNTKADLTNWRGITQTFRWHSATSGGNYLDSIGLHFDDGQTVWSSDQQYILVIHELAARTGAPTNTVAEFAFTMAKDNVVANTWLNINIDDVLMQNNQWYGFTLLPKSDSTTTQIAYWNQTTDTTEGGGTLYNASTYGYPTANYASSGIGVSFYLQTAIPEPATLGLFGTASILILMLRRLRK